jgi:hypothetical protein
MSWLSKTKQDHTPGLQGNTLYNGSTLNNGLNRPCGTAGTGTVGSGSATAGMNNPTAGTNQTAPSTNGIGSQSGPTTGSGC